METDIETKAIVERVKTQLTEFYNGSCWVTDNFSKKVLSIDQREAVMEIPGFNHSVAGLVGHITAWRNFALQKLTGNNNYDIKDESAVNWPDNKDWNAVIREFETCNHALISAIDRFSIERWNTTVPGRNYSFLYLVTGIIQHDYYHYGQIGSVLAAIKKISGAV